METARVDRWLWAVRLFKTRAAAAAACRGGHVRVNAVRVKPAAPVRVGDTVKARVGDRERVVEVSRLIEKRVGAPEAAECLVDHSPPPPPRDPWLQIARREPGAGRPSKRDRRNLDRVRGRNQGRTGR
jgi:ribosome-associated heat shock protein Hsp15